MKLPQLNLLKGVVARGATGTTSVTLSEFLMTGPIARGTTRTTLVLGLRLAVQACTLLLVARMLGPSHFGAFAGVVSLAVILGTLSTFGTHVVLMSEVSKEHARRENVLPYAVPSTLLSGSILLVVYLLMCVLALHQSDIAIGVLVAIGVTEILLQPLFSLPASEHLALGRTARSQLLQTLPLLLRLAAAAAVFVSQAADPLMAYSYGFLSASVVALAVATSTMPGRWPALRTWRLPNRTEVRETAGYAAMGITATSPAELDKTLATGLLVPTAVGIYAAGTRVIGAATLPVIAMMLAALPRLFREGRDQPERTARLLRWVFSAAFVYSTVLATLLWFIAPVFDWIFGANYDDIDEMIRWLCIVVPGMALRTAAGAVLTALGRPWMRIGFELVGVLVLVIAATVLAAYYGTIGMALALACSEWTMAIVGGILILRVQRDNTQSTRKQPTLSV